MYNSFKLEMKSSAKIREEGEKLLREMGLEKK